MSKSLFISIIVGLLLLPMTAFPEHVQVTSAVVEGYKAGFIKSCTTQAVEIGKPKDFSEKVCTCALTTLEENMTDDEFNKHIDLIAHGTSPYEIPSYMRAMGKVAACNKVATSH